MDRREFLLATGVAVAAPLLAGASRGAYDPTERSIAELGLAMRNAARRQRRVVGAKLSGAHRTF
jgi:hypothetical protein